MPVVEALCARAPVPPAWASLGGGLIAGVSPRSSSGRDCAAAAATSVTISSPGARGLVLRWPCSTPAAKAHNADLLAMEGKLRTTILRGTNLKRWVVRSSSNSEQNQEILEEKNIQSTEENKSGPPVLTIIAGLLVLFVVFWALGSLVLWIVGLIFRHLSGLLGFFYCALRAARAS